MNSIGWLLSKLRFPLKAELGGNTKDYISGLSVSCFDGAALTVTAGAAYIPSLGYVLEVPSTLTLNLTGTVAGNFYTLYLYSNAGVPALELVATAPDAPYAGTARTKTGDNSRRMLGMFRTNTTGGIWPIMSISPTEIQYCLDWSQGGFRVLGAGVAASRTTIDLAGVIPLVSNAALVALTHVGTTGAQVFSVAPDGTTALISGVTVQPSGKIVVHVPVRNNCRINYSWNVAPQGGSSAYVDVGGFTFSR